VNKLVIIYLTDKALAREIIAVPKRKLDKREAAYQRKKPEETESRGNRIAAPGQLGRWADSDRACS